MPQCDAIIFKKKGERKNLRLLLDDSDDVLQCIKQGMAEHKLQEVKIEDAEGIFKEGEMNYFSGNQYKSLKFNNHKILRAHGSFKLNFGELYGSLHVSVGSSMNPITGTLVRGKAVQGLELKLSFIELKDLPMAPVQE